MSYEEAVKITRKAGLAYLPHQDLLANVQGLVSRLQALEQSDILGKKSVPEALAYIGAAERVREEQAPHLVFRQRVRARIHDPLIKCDILP